MFFFKSLATANYEKKFYDFTIESITGETINLNDYKDKVIPSQKKNSLQVRNSSSRRSSRFVRFAWDS